MITLRTLREASLQEIFDQAARHLLAQNARSRCLIHSELTGESAMSCAYRGDGNLKCAVGVFIADDEYRPTWEGRGAEMICAGYGSDEQLSLLRQLQGIHDSYDVDAWRPALTWLAVENGISDAVLSAQP